RTTCPGWDQGWVQMAVCRSSGADVDAECLDGFFHCVPSCPEACDVDGQRVSVAEKLRLQLPPAAGIATVAVPVSLPESPSTVSVQVKNWSVLPSSSVQVAVPPRVARLPETLSGIGQAIAVFPARTRSDVVPSVTSTWPVELTGVAVLPSEHVPVRVPITSHVPVNLLTASPPPPPQPKRHTIANRTVRISRPSPATDSTPLTDGE
ncbi:MAG TPA: hypothetical protein VJV75_03830, partial [Candidatus Polarisedimenticolia bacterium]|nr:hypothetical protein [Candidatus Polarisedimenticolia bacterium]